VRNRLPSRIESLEQTGATVRVTLDAGFPLVALVTQGACEELRLAPGEAVAALVKAQAIHLVSRSR
jgi:molybdate transport system ATP-binding protein